MRLRSTASAIVDLRDYSLTIRDSSGFFVGCSLTACICILLLMLYYLIPLILIWDYNKKDVVHQIHLIKICQKNPEIFSKRFFGQKCQKSPYISAVYLNEEHQIHHNVTYQYPRPKLKVLRTTQLLIQTYNNLQQAIMMCTNISFDRNLISLYGSLKKKKKKCRTK